MVTCFPYLLAWVMAVIAANMHSFEMLYISRLLVGVGHGLVSTTIYTVEVVRKEYRGSFSIFEGVQRSVGMIVTYSLGAILPWYKIAYIGFVFPVLAFILLVISPESPIYLTSKGKIEQAEKSLRKLNDFNFDVSKEVSAIQLSLDKTTRENAKSRSKLEIFKNIKSHPELYKPFLIITFLRFSKI